ncbi:MAG: hypothetical protein AAF998_28755 [Bacteroidota bacterium]
MESEKNKHPDEQLIKKLLGFAYDDWGDMHVYVNELQGSLSLSAPDTKIKETFFDLFIIFINNEWIICSDPETSNSSDGTVSGIKAVALIEERWKQIAYSLPDFGEIMWFTLTEKGKQKYNEL